MTVIVLCPACGTATPFHRGPISECPQCHTSLPPAIVGPTERALEVEQTPKPLLLQLGMLFSLAFGSIFILIFLPAVFNVGSYSISGTPVTASEFLREGAPTLAPVGILTLAIRIGLWLERPWTRIVMMACLAVLIAVTGVQMWTGALTGGEGAIAIVQWILTLAIAWWYLYKKANVAAYYRVLERHVWSTSANGARS